MKSETIVGIVLVLLLLATIQPATCDLIIITKEGQASSLQVFRILVVEGDASGYFMASGELLISALLGFSNWDNSFTDYVSYIHLLSLYGQDEVMDECKPYWRGDSTKANVRSEILNFLASASPNENVIFYYCGEGSIATRLILDEGISPTELTSWLSSGGLPQANVCVVLDSCHSGSWIDDGVEPGGYLGPGRVVLCSCLSNQSSAGWPVSAWMWFTGREKTRYRNGTYSPLGVIGGLFAGNDTNGDKWISMMECFAFAKPSTEQYSLQESEYWDEDYLMNPVSYNGLGFDPPFVKLPERLEANFTVNPTKPVVNENVVFNASTSEGIITNYIWNFGDDNVTTVSIPAITHRYEQTGNYTITLTINNNGSNSTSKTITVYRITDLNKDGIVNILDIALVASVYGTQEGDPNWNETADMDNNGEINILDISTVAKDYGKIV